MKKLCKITIKIWNVNIFNKKYNNKNDYKSDDSS